MTGVILPLHLYAFVACTGIYDFTKSADGQNRFTGIRRKQLKDWFLCRTWPRRDNKPLTLLHNAHRMFFFFFPQFSIIRSNGMQCPTYTVQPLDDPAVISHYIIISNERKQCLLARHWWAAKICIETCVCMEFNSVIWTKPWNIHNTPNRIHGVKKSYDHDMDIRRKNKYPLSLSGMEFTHHVLRHLPFRVIETQ